MSHAQLRDAWYLVGPTASGKTGIGLELAERLNAEILSLDSMSIYRGMDIGTAKPTPAQQARVPHHLIDLVEPAEAFSVPQYVCAAHEAVRDVRRRGREPLFVGGTPLYLKALLRGIFAGPPADWEFRRQIEEELKDLPPGALHERLRQVDPLSAARLHPHDKRRMIRALEVYRQTGRPISHEQFHFEEVPSEPSRVFVLQWPRPQLHLRIEERVQRMFDMGLVDEVRSLMDRFGQLSRTASQAVGYREVLAHLQGMSTLPRTIELVMRRTRQFARRQLTWFRGLEECRTIELDEGLDAGRAAEQILTLAGDRRPR
jgi:tRNA dimethylallyltransferase